MKKYLPTRRRKTLRRFLIFLVFLALSLYISPYGFLPAQSLRSFEEAHLTGKTEILHRGADRSLPIRGITLPTLSENDSALVWCLHRFHPMLGWYPVVGIAVDCSGDAPFSVGYSSIYDHRNGKSFCVFCGRIRDARIASVELWMFPLYDSDLSPSDTSGILVTRQAGFHAGDGWENFCLYGEELQKRVNGSDGEVPALRPWVRCYDADGALLFSEEVTCRWSTSMG